MAEDDVEPVRLLSPPSLYSTGAQMQDLAHARQVLYQLGPLSEFGTRDPPFHLVLGCTYSTIPDRDSISPCLSGCLLSALSDLSYLLGNTFEEY